jgi:DNA-binding transcriptional LysR family regulator
VRLVVSEALDSQMDHNLQSASVDMALRYLHASRLRPSDQVLKTVGTYLVGPPGDKLIRKRSLPFAALAGLPLALPCRPSAWRDALDALAHQRGFDLTVALEADSLQVQKQAAMQGLAYTLLGPLALEGERQSLQMALITDPPLPRAMVLTLRPGLTLRRAHEVVAQAIMAQAHAQP